MIGGSLSSFSRCKWLKPKGIKLGLAKGEKIRGVFEVTKELTTNRTGKEGDEIISTPSMIKLMDTLACDLVKSKVGQNYTPVTSRVSMQHKAPLPIGNNIVIDGEVIEVSGGECEIRMIGRSQETSKVIGDGKIHVVVVE